MASETINFGQIFAVAVVGFLLYRWFSGPTPPSSQSSGRNGGRQVNPEHVETVAAMFPQLDRRAIIWDLHRNGGSVQATIERLLGGRSLDTVRAFPWVKETSADLFQYSPHPHSSLRSLALQPHPRQADLLLRSKSTPTSSLDTISRRVSMHKRRPRDLKRRAPKDGLKTRRKDLKCSDEEERRWCLLQGERCKKKTKPRQHSTVDFCASYTYIPDPL